MSIITVKGPVSTQWHYTLKVTCNLVPTLMEARIQKHFPNGYKWGGGSPS